MPPIAATTGVPQLLAISIAGCLDEKYPVSFPLTGHLQPVDLGAGAATGLGVGLGVALGVGVGVGEGDGEGGIEGGPIDGSSQV